MRETFLFHLFFLSAIDVINTAKLQEMVSIRPLNSELQKIAIEELNEVPSRISEDLEAIREWLAKQSHLKSRTGGFQIIIFDKKCRR